jgi:GMP synthase (glutamine-hydrolysing)
MKKDNTEKNISFNPADFISNSINEIKKQVGPNKVICALSGGVDSTVLAILLHKAIGKQLFCVHVDSGLMRLNESNIISQMFAKSFDINIKIIEAQKKFFTALKGVKDPEKKRKQIGKTFIDVFEKEAKKHKDIKFLAQGTIYPDVIESLSEDGKSKTIKSHHNVGGLPEKMNLKLVEPFRKLYKNEVRLIGKELGIPE